MKYFSNFNIGTLFYIARALVNRNSILSTQKNTKRQAKDKMSKHGVTVRHLLDEPQILERAKLEGLLAVTLGARPCALLNIPADLPEGERLASEVEQSCRDAYLRAAGETDSQKKLQRVREFTQERREAFSRIVLGSTGYHLLISWSKRLGLDTVTSEVLPTTWDLYLYKGLRMRMRIRRLTAMRFQLRQQKRADMFGESPPLFIEEFSSEYVLELGQLLGYPLCCVRRFIEDRNAQFSAEERASEQLRSTKTEGKEIDLFAYPLKNFFPCSPECKQARAYGEGIHKLVSQALPEAGERYRKLLMDNSSLVESYPDIMRIHREKLQDRSLL